MQVWVLLHTACSGAPACSITFEGGTGSVSATIRPDSCTGGIANVAWLGLHMNFPNLHEGRYACRGGVMPHASLVSSLRTVQESLARARVAERYFKARSSRIAIIPKL